MSLTDVSEVVSRVLAGTHDSKDLARLIDHFSSGKSLTPLEAILDDPSGSAISDGLYILSEIGRQGWPLTAKAARLVNYPDEDVRFFSIACVLVAPRAAGRESIAEILQRLTDDSSRVRWRAIDFASMIDDDLLQGCLEYFKAAKDAKHVAGILLLLKASVTSRGVLIDAIDSPEPLARAYGVAAAARLVNVGREIARRASESPDQSVSEFAKGVF